MTALSLHEWATLFAVALDPDAAATKATWEALMDKGLIRKEGPTVPTSLGWSLIERVEREIQP